MPLIKNAAGTTLTQTVYTGAHATNDLGNSYTVPYDIFLEERFPGQPWASTRRRKSLKYRAGQVITQTQLNDLYAEPTFVSIAPTGGTTAGSTAVTITGTNLDNVTSVTIGVAATSVVATSETTITAVTGATTAGAKNVVIVTPAGTATGTGAYTYA